MSLAMTTEERETFLAALHVGVIGVNHGDVPLAVPIWYGYEPGGDIWIVMNPSSIKGKALDATGRYSMCAQSESLPYKYVTVTGTVATVEPATKEATRALAHKYLGPELGDQYVEATAGTAGSSTLYRLTPERWYTVDYSKDFG